MYTPICEECGKFLEVGDWPLCPHERATGAEIGMLGQFATRYDEHVCPEGAVITSLADRKKLMKQNNLHERGKKVGMPGCEI